MPNITPSFWKKKRVLLTGHTGYVMKESHELNFKSAIEVITAWLNKKPINIIKNV